MKSNLWRQAALAAITALLVLVAVACGTGQEEESTPSTAVLPTPAVQGTPRPLPTVDLSSFLNASLVEYRSPDKGYTISYPEGWKVSASAGGPLDTFLGSTPEGRAVAQLSVACFEGDWTLDKLVAQDMAVISHFQGSASAPQPLEIAGETGSLLTYSMQFEQLSVEHSVGYLVRGKCGWRVDLTSYGVGTRLAFQPMFERIIASFQPG